MRHLGPAGRHRPPPPPPPPLPPPPPPPPRPPRLGPQLPDGLRILDAELVPHGEASIVESVRAIHYRADFPQDLWGERALSERAAAFRQAEQSVVTRGPPRKGGGGKRQHKG